MPRTLSQAKYRNNSIRINREGLKALRVVINEWMAFTRKASIKGLNQLIRKGQILKSESVLYAQNPTKGIESRRVDFYIAKSEEVPIRKDVAQQIALELTDWEIVEKEGIVKIKPVILEIVKKAGENTTKLFDIKASFDIVNIRSVELAEQITARLVTEVTLKTQEGIATAIRIGAEKGQSIPAIAKNIKPLVGLTQAQVVSVANFEEAYIIKFPGANRDRIDRAVNRYERKKHRERSEMIARTESSRTNAEGSLDVYQSEGVTVEWIAVAGNDFDPEFCQDNDGKVFSIQEARGLIPVHPNCECIWGPHVEVAALAA